MKKIAVIVGAFLVSVLTIFSILTSEPKNETPVSTSQNNTDVNKQKGNSGNSTNLKTSYVKQPFPTNIPTEAQCQELNVEQYRLREKSDHDIELKALQAFKNGYTAKQVAEAIWFSSYWSVAKNWYDKAALAESVEKLLPILKTMPNNERLLNQYNYDKELGKNLRNVIDYTGSVDLLWKHIATDSIHRKVSSTNTSAVEIFNEIELAFSEIPYEILNNNRLSPLYSILNLLVAKQELPTAIMLLQRYPDLRLSDVNLDNKLAIAFLSVIGSEDYEITNPTEYQLFLSLLGLLDKQVFYQKVTHPLFGNEKVSNGIKKLNDKGITIKVALVDDKVKPNPILQLNIEKSELTDEQKLVLKKCDSINDWLNSRKLTLDKIETFKDDPFIAAIKSSPEFKNCKNKQPPHNLQLIKSQFTATNEIVTQALGNQGISLAELDLATLDLPELLPETKSILAVIMARDYLQATNLTEQEIITRLSNVSLKPSGKYSELLAWFAGLKGLTLWLNSLNFEQPEGAQLLLNKFAGEGVFEPFEILNTRLGGVAFNTQDELDPFYFFIQNYSEFSFHSGDPSTYESKKNKAFIDFFTRNGVKIKLQHLRAAFALKTQNKESYNRLITHFPELQVQDGQEYFSIDCR